MTLGLIDWIIIVVYMVGCVAAGVWMRRYVRNVEDFAVAGREMDVNLGIASLAATEMGIVTMMYCAQMGFTSGFAGATPGVLVAVAMLVVGVTGFRHRPAAPHQRDHHPRAVRKTLRHRRALAGRRGHRAGRRVEHGDLSPPRRRVPGERHGPAHTNTWNVTMTGLLAIVLVYTVLGGMLSVLVTDYLQFLVMGLGIVITSVLVVANTGWSELVAGLWAAHESGQALVQTGGTESFKMGNPFNPIASDGHLVDRLARLDRRGRGHHVANHHRPRPQRQGRSNGETDLPPDVVLLRRPVRPAGPLGRGGVLLLLVPRRPAGGPRPASPPCPRTSKPCCPPA